MIFYMYIYIIIYIKFNSLRELTIESISLFSPSLLISDSSSEMLEVHFFFTHAEIFTFCSSASDNM